MVFFWDLFHNLYNVRVTETDMSVVVVDEQSACVLPHCDRCLFVFNAYNVTDMYCFSCILSVHDICFHFFVLTFFVGNRPLLIANKHVW